jgi:hypothetical protein
MADFCKGLPRWLALSAALTFFAAAPPEILARGPDICLWKRLFHIAACPACGSTRALAAFFHGNIEQALAYNRNVLVTAPLLVSLLVVDAARGVRALAARFMASHVIGR